MRREAQASGAGELPVLASPIGSAEPPRSPCPAVRLLAVLPGAALAVLQLIAAVSSLLLDFLQRVESKL